jgi:hypothetical protein
MKKSTTSRVGPKRDPRSDRKNGKGSTSRFSVRELGSTTWPDFERVVEKHNGVWGGCWCVAFHLKRSDEKEWTGKHRALKEKLVRANQSHAALVYDGADVVGWCQFGPPVELPGRMSGYAKLDETPPALRARLASSPPREAGRLMDIRSTLEGNRTRVRSCGVELKQCSSGSDFVRSVPLVQVSG